MLKLILLLVSIPHLALGSNKFDVKVKEGVLRGMKLKNLRGETIHAYLGIPYGKPPVGELRFQDPEPADKWDEIKDAVVMPDACMQPNLILKVMGKSPLTGNEDCLYLNVYKSTVTERGKLPVIVYIHGGGFIFGGANEYNHKNILDYEVILVVLQYRLGVFGFMSTDETPLTGNYGLKDQQLALKWVKKNIAQFNGDPDRITIMGESAGAASVHYHILSDGSKGLFNRAVLLSGNAICPWARNTNHRKFADAIGNHFDCSMADGSNSYRDCMLKIDAEEIVTYHMNSFKFLSTPNFMVPRVDGSFLKNLPELLQKYQLYDDVDVIMGMARDEGAIFLVGINENLATEDIDLKRLQILLALEEQGFDDKQSAELTSSLMAKYKNDKRFADDEEMITQLLSDHYFNFCHHVTAQYFAKNKKMKSFAFELWHKTTTPNEDILSSIPTKYIPHLEITRLLINGGGIFPIELVESDDIYVKKALLTAITSFARTGDPSSRTTFGSKWTQTNESYFAHHNIKYLQHPVNEIERKESSIDDSPETNLV